MYVTIQAIFSEAHSKSAKKIRLKTTGPNELGLYPFLFSMWLKPT